MAHTVVGFPSVEKTIEIVKILEEAGADMVELQIPFSDPLADGPTIMKACEDSLARGIKVKDSFIVMKKLAKEIKIPLLFMCYYNIVFKYGVEKFCKDAKEAGASGIIVPDMPVDEEGDEHLLEYCQKYKLYNIQVISSFSPDHRVKLNAEKAEGFVYVTSRRGTTGVKENLDSQLSKNLERIKKFFSIPIAVGFGISSKEQIGSLLGKAEIAVIGSAIIDVIRDSKENEIEKNVSKFLKEMVF